MNEEFNYVLFWHGDFGGGEGGGEIGGEIFLEFDSRGLTNPCDFIFKNHYAAEPFVLLGITSDNSEAFPSPVTLVASPLNALDDNSVRYYYGVRATVVGDYPINGNHKITMLAICTNKIDDVAPTS